MITLQRIWLGALLFSCLAWTDGNRAMSQEAADDVSPPVATAPEEPSAAVEAIRQTDPQTPDQLMRAIDQLIRLERSDVAGEYLDRLVKLSLDDSALAALYEQFGTATMLRLARTSDLAPQAGDFANSVMQAGRKMLEDPDQLAEWVKQLGSEDQSVRFHAAQQLLRAGRVSVPPLINALAAAGPNEENLIRLGGAVLQRLGVDALEPLYGFMTSNDSAQRVAAISAMGSIGSKECLPMLVQPLFAPRSGEAEMQAAAGAWQRIVHRIPSRDEAIALLEHEAERAYAGQAGAADPDDQVTRWTWNAELRQPVATSMRSSDAAAVSAARLYAALVRLRPDDHQAAQHYLVSRLEVDQSLGSLDQPLRRGAGTAFDAARNSGSIAVNLVLARALEDGHDAAAIGAAEVLGELADRDVLRRTSLDQSGPAAPLVRALSHPNRRVRFAAAQALSRLQPPGSFDGAGRLADALDYFATSRGQRAAVVAHPNPTRAQNTAGRLSSRGFRTTTVNTARQLLEAALSADVEFVVLSDALNDDSLWSTIEQLRVHPKTARLPIAVLKRNSTRDDTLRTVEAQPRVMVWNESLDDEALDLQLPQLLDLADRDAISPERRLEHAAAAIEMLDRLIGSSQPAQIDLEDRLPRLISALAAPGLMADTTRLLSHVPARDAQLALLDLTGQHARPLSERQAAAQAFTRSLARHGVLLSRDEIARQYGRYNESRELDRETQELLGSTLDAIENPRQAESPAR
jgi:HEAT repeat protein